MPDYTVHIAPGCEMAENTSLLGGCVVYSPQSISMSQCRHTSWSLAQCLTYLRDLRDLNNNKRVERCELASPAHTPPFNAEGRRFALLIQN